MAEKLTTNTGDLKTLFLDAAIELSLDNGGAFVEKDFYMTQIVHAVSPLVDEGIFPVFCGGTSLSKCFGAIERFSEDIDFRGVFENGEKAGKGNRRRYREAIIRTINSINGLEVDRDSLQVGGNYFKMFINYPSLFDAHDSLRAQIQCEFSFTQPNYQEGFMARPAQALIERFSTEVSKQQPVLCVSPIETAADKLSALIWRISKRDRSSDKDDPAMIRHLHDLFALRDVISSDLDLFSQLSLHAHDADNKNGARELDASLGESFQNIIDILHGDKLYEEEYRIFVERVSFSETPITFLQALNHLESLYSSLFPSHKPGF